MHHLLHIETATDTCSVALSEGDMLIALKETQIPRAHSQKLTVFIHQLFDETGIKPDDLKAIAVSMGPGSYTGLRIGVSVAKGLAFSLNKPLIAINTLHAMTTFAIELAEAEVYCPMIDARRMEVYYCLLDRKMKELRTTAAEVIDENSFREMLEAKTVAFFGTGMEKCRSLLSSERAVFPDVRASAKSLISLAWQKFSSQDFEDVSSFEPFYLKDFLANNPIKKLNKVLNK